MKKTALATPCTGVDRSLSDPDRLKVAPSLVTQLKVALPAITTVDVLSAYHYQGWGIFRVDTHVSDEGFVFFHGDPAKNHYVTIWAGAAIVTGCGN